MKKFIGILASLTMCMALFAGCQMLSDGNLGGPGGQTPEEQTAIELVEEMYEKISQATVITRDINVANGRLVQYESHRTYTRDGDEYQVTGTSKKLSLIDPEAEGAYTTATENLTLPAAEFEAKLDLNEIYFSNTPTYENGVLEVGIADNSVKTALGITEDLPAPVHGMNLKITTDKGFVTGIEITYASKSSNVTITLGFTYQGD